MRLHLRRRLPLAAAVALGAVLAIAACTRAIVQRHDTIRSAHGAHIRAGVPCQGCHAGAIPGSTQAEETAPEARPLLPSEAHCLSCHEDERQNCAYCHTEPSKIATYPPRDSEVRFNHDAHVSRMEARCVTCHHATTGSATSAAAYHPRRTPSMSNCTNECHAVAMREMDCVLCHRSLESYELSQVVTVRHEGGFVRRHGIPARAEPGLCAQCHDPSYCARCHEAAASPIPLAVREATALTRDFVHRPGFLARHSTEGRTDQGTCNRCHGVQFCDSCHRDSGVGGSVAPGSPHGPGWLDPASPRGHARQGRRDIMRCAACHESDAQTTCVPCHRVGGVASSPHPPGFGRGRDRERHGMCRACHVGGP